MRRPRIKSDIDCRIFDLINKIHSDNKELAQRKFKMYKLKYEYLENYA